MTRIAIVLSLLAMCGEARAEFPSPPPPPPPPITHDFWRDMLEPHGTEVAAIVRNAREAIKNADTMLTGDFDPTGEGRLRYFQEAYGPLRYARRLAPDNLDVLRLLGQTADELGRTRQAIEALHAAIDIVGPEKAGAEITGRLGAIYLRLGELDDAIRYLRIAQAPPTNAINAQVLVHLSNALALRGETTEAIDVLANNVPANPAYYPNELSLVAFALAVQYDRDEQRGAAFEVLDRMQTVMQNQLAVQVQNALATMRYAPAEDQHYFLGLLYESAGNYAEARVEWALYAAAGNLPYRARALEHVAAIDGRRPDPPSHPQRLHSLVPPP